MGGRIPASAASVKTGRKSLPDFSVHDFLPYSPCWRFGHFDVEGRWGLKSLLGDFVFHASEDLEDFALEINDDYLLKAIDTLEGGHFESLSSFWEKFHNIYRKDIPINIIKLIEVNLTRTLFLDKIYPRLKAFEDSTWGEIENATHDNGRNSNHTDLVSRLTKEAQDRLAELNFSDRSEIFSMRLGNKIRIFGFREMNYLDIIWLDLNHEVYKPQKKHT